ncbi:hypothetical protein DW1_1933 [Proteiniborus sp. DW1]|uniref:hypothetical protein n=1 Tax=Proteiniborus sp. DW1 TaxID=1889883 RepID=UPI00092DEB64|nr:hypothetical protein [Proteiniborus sp. DW1]SCG83501.1 hypothetical protein DW1_1933 [Proteiniborus sp. DW1]
MRRYRRYSFKKHFIDGSIKKLLGMVLGILGVIIIIQVVPIKAWIFALGLLFICLGWFLYKIN